MRTDMSVPLPDMFALLGKKITPTNVAELSWFAVTNLTIFQYAFVGDAESRNRAVARDMTDMYLAAYNIQWWDVYAEIVKKTISLYPVATYQVRENVEAIYAELAKAHADVNKLLSERGIATI